MIYLLFIFLILISLFPVIVIINEKIVPKLNNINKFKIWWIKHIISDEE